MATNISVTAPAVGPASGSPAGTFTLSDAISCPNTAFAIVSYPFASALTLAVSSPSGAQAAVIVPPPTNVAALSINGSVGGTGPIGISPTQITILTFPSSSGVTTFYLTSAGAVTGTNVQVIFY